jgi:AcrR family transcriptional regulator
MSKARAKKKEKSEDYHHKDLRRAILAASLELVEKEGVAALSMREVARRAGVSHGAPYHHFPDRAAILAAVAALGFEKLAEVLRETADAHEDPLARFEALGRAYFHFALENPGYYRVMFRPELHDPTEHPDVDAAGTAAFQVLVFAIVACQDAGVAPPGDPLPVVLATWASAHGLAALWVDGPLARGALGLGDDPAGLAKMVSKTVGSMLAAAGRAASSPR